MAFIMLIIPSKYQKKIHKKSKNIFDGTYLNVFESKITSLFPTSNVHPLKTNKGDALSAQADDIKRKS